MSDDEEEEQSSEGPGEWARAEANSLKQDLAKVEKKYVEARKAGMRDKATMQYLGLQPEIFGKKKKKKLARPSSIAKATPEEMKQRSIEEAEERNTPEPARQKADDVAASPPLGVPTKKKTAEVPKKKTEEAKQKKLTEPGKPVPEQVSPVAKEAVLETAKAAPKEAAIEAPREAAKDVSMQAQREVQKSPGEQWPKPNFASKMGNRLDWQAAAQARAEAKSVPAATANQESQLADRSEGQVADSVQDRYEEAAEVQHEELPEAKSSSEEQNIQSAAETHAQQDSEEDIERKKAAHWADALEQALLAQGNGKLTRAELDLIASFRGKAQSPSDAMKKEAESDPGKAELLAAAEEAHIAQQKALEEKQAEAKKQKLQDEKQVAEAAQAQVQVSPAKAHGAAAAQQPAAVSVKPQFQSRMQVPSAQAQAQARREAEGSRSQARTPSRFWGEKPVVEQAIPAAGPRPQGRLWGAGPRPPAQQSPSSDATTKASASAPGVRPAAPADRPVTPTARPAAPALRPPSDQTSGKPAQTPAGSTGKSSPAVVPSAVPLSGSAQPSSGARPASHSSPSVAPLATGPAVVPQSGNAGAAPPVVPAREGAAAENQSASPAIRPAFSGIQSPRRKTTQTRIKGPIAPLPPEELAESAAVAGSSTPPVPDYRATGVAPKELPGPISMKSAAETRKSDLAKEFKVKFSASARARLDSRIDSEPASNPESLPEHPPAPSYPQAVAEPQHTSSPAASSSNSPPLSNRAPNTGLPPSSAGFSPPPVSSAAVSASAPAGQGGYLQDAPPYVDPNRSSWEKPVEQKPVNQENKLDAVAGQSPLPPAPKPTAKASSPVPPATKIPLHGKSSSSNSNSNSAQPMNVAPPPMSKNSPAGTGAPSGPAAASVPEASSAPLRPGSLADDLPKTSPPSGPSLTGASAPVSGSHGAPPVSGPSGSLPSLPGQAQRPTSSGPPGSGPPASGRPPSGLTDRIAMQKMQEISAAKAAQFAAQNQEAKPSQIPEPRPGSSGQNPAAQVTGPKPHEAQHLSTQSAANQETPKQNAAAGSLQKPGEKQQAAAPQFADEFDRKHRPVTQSVKKIVQAKREFTYKYPDGSKTTVKYGSNNLLNEIHIDGGRWIKDKDERGWTFFDEKNRKQDHMDGDLDVTDKGDIVATRRDGYCETQFADGTFQIQNPDKSKEIHYPDGTCVLEDAQGRRTYRSKAGIETKVGSDKPKQEKKKTQGQNKPIRPHRMTELNKKLSNILDYNDAQKQWQAYEGQSPEDGVSWFKNQKGDILKQDSKDGSNSIYHKDGSWEHIDKNGKVTLHLGDDWADL